MSHAPRFVRNQSELATALGVSRQLIAWHIKQPGSPVRRADGRYCVEEWRKHFATKGRVDVHDQNYSDNEELRTMHPKDRLLIIAFSYLCKSLPQCVDDTLSHTQLSQSEKDMITLRLWANLASVVVLGVGNPDDGTSIIPIKIPEPIRAIADKLNIKLNNDAFDTLLT